MKTAFTESYTENPFWIEQFALRHYRKLKGGHPIVDFGAAADFRLYATTMNAMNIPNDIPSIPIDQFKDRYVLVFDLTSMQDATEKCHYPEQVEEKLRLGLNFCFPLEHVTQIIVLGDRMSWVAVDKFGVVRENIQNGYRFSPSTNQPYPTTQVWVPWFLSL